LDEPHVHLLILWTFRLDGVRLNKLSCASVPKKFSCSKRIIERECTFVGNKKPKADTVARTSRCVGMYKFEPHDGLSKSWQRDIFSTIPDHAWHRVFLLHRCSIAIAI